MKIPNADRAVVDIAKLRDYCLNPFHPVGKHKARVFQSALDLTSENSEELRSTLLNAIRVYDAELGQEDEYGQRYVLSFLMIRGERRAQIISAWLVRINEDFLRLVTCYVD